MKIINAILKCLFITTGLSGCSFTVSTQHHVQLDHNININVKDFNVGITHKHVDVNGTTRVMSEQFSMSNAIKNININDTNTSNY